jgi:hypothetical protein
VFAAAAHDHSQQQPVIAVDPHRVHAPSKAGSGGGPPLPLLAAGAAAAVAVALVAFKRWRSRCVRARALARPGPWPQRSAPGKESTGCPANPLRANRSGSYGHGDPFERGACAAAAVDAL